MADTMEVTGLGGAPMGPCPPREFASAVSGACCWAKVQARARARLAPVSGWPRGPQGELASTRARMPAQWWTQKAGRWGREVSGGFDEQCERTRLRRVDRAEEIGLFGYALIRQADDPAVSTRDRAALKRENPARIRVRGAGAQRQGGWGTRCMTP